MNQNVVRLVEMEIDSMKNVLHGKLEFANSRSGSILGIYGQNGSGKTVVVDCMILLKSLLSGKRIPHCFANYINSNRETARVRYCFHIKAKDSNYYAEYEVELMKSESFSFCISNEKLSVKNSKDEKRTKLTPLFDYHKGEKDLFRPLKYYNYFGKNIEQIIALGIAQQSTENYNE